MAFSPAGREGPADGSPRPRPQRPRPDDEDSHTEAQANPRAPDLRDPRWSPASGAPLLFLGLRLKLGELDRSRARVMFPVAEATRAVPTTGATAAEPRTCSSSTPDSLAAPMLAGTKPAGRRSTRAAIHRISVVITRRLDRIGGHPREQVENRVSGCSAIRSPRPGSFGRTLCPPRPPWRAAVAGQPRLAPRRPNARS
jgi:hypothetical protein